MILWLKFAHVAAIAIWSAGLICLPWLYVQRPDTRDTPEIYRLQALVRFAYVALISPAAFVAVGTGIGLIFVAGTFEAWFSLKLVLVGALVGVHILTGLVIIKLFEEGEAYPRWRFVLVTVATVAIVVAILVVVSAKPIFDFAFLGEFLATPGALGEWGGDLIPWVRR